MCEGEEGANAVWRRRASDAWMELQLQRGILQLRRGVLRLRRGALPLNCGVLRLRRGALPLHRGIRQLRRGPLQPAQVRGASLPYACPSDVKSEGVSGPGGCW